MRRIFALRGKADSGKTATIRILYDLLVQNGFQLINTDINTRLWDFVAIFSRNGILIGVTSCGDTYDYVHDRLQELISAGCSMCICACRSYDRVPPGTNAAILEFTDFTNQFIQKTIDTNPATQDATNRSDANQLLTIIVSAL